MIDIVEIEQLSHNHYACQLKTCNKDKGRVIQQCIIIVLLQL